MFLEPFSITINGQPYQLGQPPPTQITHLDITIRMPMQVPSNQIPHIKAWLNSIIDHLACDYVTYNDALIPATELTSF